MISSLKSHTIEYSISDASGGIHLKIWEPAPRGRQGKRCGKPYLFMSNYLLPSEEAAKQVLNTYLHASGAKRVEHSQLSRRGHLKVMPDPTDEIWF